jgi:hypothetical protein
LARLAWEMIIPEHFAAHETTMHQPVYYSSPQNWLSYHNLFKFQRVLTLNLFKEILSFATKFGCTYPNEKLFKEDFFRMSPIQ